ncbi:hypothetical protein ACFL23_02595 [Patescibacteria group bacterium]
MTKKAFLVVCFLVVCFCVSMATVSNGFMFNEYETLYCYSNLVENKTSSVSAHTFPHFHAISERYIWN